jgi:hypothetical protein
MRRSLKNLATSQPVGPEEVLARITQATEEGGAPPWRHTTGDHRPGSKPLRDHEDQGQHQYRLGLAWAGRELTTRRFCSWA